jgi:hypothetical protein
LTAEHLGFYNRDMKCVVEPGEFTIRASRSPVGGLTTLASIVVFALAVACGVRTRPSRVTPPVDPFLETLEQRTFEWFWDTANAANGLVPDRWPDVNFSSIAAIGFGLTAYGVGAERGYITRERARERTLATLRFLWNAPQNSGPRDVTGHRGFFYHFLDMENAEVPDRRAVGHGHGAHDGRRAVRAVVSFDRDEPSERGSAAWPISCTGASSGAGCSRAPRSLRWRGGPSRA